MIGNVELHELKDLETKAQALADVAVDAYDLDHPLDRFVAHRRAVELEDGSHEGDEGRHVKDAML